MSTKTDEYEDKVAAWINTNSPDIRAVRPPANTAFSDIWLQQRDEKITWLEVKTNHTDNLLNPRVYYDGRWKTTSQLIATPIILHMLNNSRETREFVRRLSEFADIPVDKIKIPGTKSQFANHPHAIDKATMEGYFQLEKDKYIAKVENYDIGNLVTPDLIKKNVSYMQAGDDFYFVGNENPYDLPSDIPTFEGYGDVKVRVSIRKDDKKTFEIHPEIKLGEMPHSQYSVMPGTHKINPFNPQKPWYY